MGSREAVSNLFGLEKDEAIYEDFSCNYHGKIKYPGKLYCCDGHICFYSNMIGVVRKHVLELEKIEEVYFETEQMVIKTQKDQKYTYGGFKDDEKKEKCFTMVAKICGDDKVNESFTENQMQMRKEVKEIIIKDVDNFSEIFRVELPVTVPEFLDRFIADDAVFGYQDFLKSRNDMLVESSRWETNPNNNLKQRSITYESWIRDSPLGCKHNSTMNQSYKIINEALNFFIKIKRQGPPFSNMYFLEEELNLTPLERDSSLLIVKVGILFSKKCPFKDKIKSNYSQECFEFYKTWLEAATRKKVFGPRGVDINLPSSLEPLEIIPFKPTQSKLKENLKTITGLFISGSHQNMTSADKIKSIEKSMERAAANQLVIIIVLVLCLFFLFFNSFGIAKSNH